MINKDEEQFLDFMGGTAVMMRDIELMGSPPHQGKPCSEALFGLKSTECADFQVKF